MDFFSFVQDKKNCIMIVSIVLNITLLIAGGYLLYRYLNYDCPPCSKTLSLKDDGEEDDKTDLVLEPEQFHVEVKGAVTNPGVYPATKENIINDIIVSAGGFTKNAYTNNINLSREVTKSLVVYVYTKDEYQKKLDSLTAEEQENTPIVSEPCECPTYDISSCIFDYDSEIVLPEEEQNQDQSQNQLPDSATDNNYQSDTGNTSTTNDSYEESNSSTNKTKIININTASKNELMTLNGIGSSKADLIISYRQSNGKFKSIDEIKNVKGIGDAVFAKIKDYITV